MVSSGLRDKGYEYINIDDCWQAPERDSHGRLQADPIRFPRGIKHVAEYVHKRGLKLGIYSDVGEWTCQHFPGSFNFYDIDARTFEEWGVDYLKLDFCFLNEEIKAAPWIYYTRMSEALQRIKRPIFYSICNWGVFQPWLWAPKIAHAWRTTGDIYPYYPWVNHILDEQEPLAQHATAGRFNDPDMLEVGVNSTVKDTDIKVNLTENESRSHFSLWSLISAPLLLGNDLRRLDEFPWVKSIISNEEVIAVNQDDLVEQGRRVYREKVGLFSKEDVCMIGRCKHVEIWTRNLSGGRVAAVLYNRGGNPDERSTLHKEEAITLTWEMIQQSANAEFTIRDLWEHKDVGVFSGSYQVVVKPHCVQMVILTPVKAASAVATYI
eukprot:GILI01006168.1.p2 GENE.GILI01006168.1~~GILI01006168.1.p2  ORF type:complete len:445 (-),score=145.39 GILI01006168.1:92-1228(-)